MKSNQIYDLLSFDLSSLGLFLATSSSLVLWLIAFLMATVFWLAIALIIAVVESYFAKNSEANKLPFEETDTPLRPETDKETEKSELTAKKSTDIQALLAVSFFLFFGLILYFGQSSKTQYENTVGLKLKEPKFLSSLAKSISSDNSDTLPDFLHALSTANCYAPSVLSSSKPCDMAGIDLVLREYLKYPITAESSELLVQSKILLNSPQSVIDSVVKGDLSINAISSFGKNLKIQNRIQFENLFIRNLTVGRLTVDYNSGEAVESIKKLSGNEELNLKSIGLITAESEKIQIEPVTLNKMAEDVYSDCAGLLSSTCFSFKKFYVEKSLPEGSSANSMSKAELLRLFNESVLRANKTIGEVK